MSCDVRKYNPLYNRFCFFWVIARWQKSGQQMNHSNPVSLPFTWRNLALPRSCFLIWTCASAWELRNTKCNCCAIWSGRFFFELCRFNLLNTDISSSYYPCHILSMLIWLTLKCYLRMCYKTCFEHAMLSHAWEGNLWVTKTVRIGLAYVLAYGQSYGLGICIGFFYNKFV